MVKFETFLQNGKYKSLKTALNIRTSARIGTQALCCRLILNQIVLLPDSSHFCSDSKNDGEVCIDTFVIGLTLQLSCEVFVVASFFFGIYSNSIVAIYVPFKC